MFITALFTIARTWKQPRCPSKNEWTKRLWYIYTMEYYSTIKTNTCDSVLIRQMNLEPIIQNEMSEIGKQILYINAYIWNLERWYSRTYLQGSSGNTDREKVLVDMGQGRKRWDKFRDQHRNIYITIRKIRQPVEIFCMAQGAQTQCSVTTKRGGMG